MRPHILFIKHFFTLFGKETLLPNMIPSISLQMLLLATMALFLMSMPASYEARRILNGEEQNLTKKNRLLLESSLQTQGHQVPPISVSMLNPPTTIGNTSSSTISQKGTFTSDHIKVLPLLRRQLGKGPVPPSTPNPGTHVQPKMDTSIYIYIYIYIVCL